MPTTGDQYPNSETVKKLKMARTLDLHSFNATELSAIILEILDADSVERKSAQKVRDMLRFERESGIAIEGQFMLKRFMRMRQKNFEEFWMPKNVGWIRHFYFDFVLVLVTLVWICCL
jgi:hypothetical protein